MNMKHLKDVPAAYDSGDQAIQAHVRIPDSVDRKAWVKRQSLGRKTRGPVSRSNSNSSSILGTAGAGGSAAPIPPRRSATASIPRRHSVSPPPRHRKVSIDSTGSSPATEVLYPSAYRQSSAPTPRELAQLQQQASLDGLMARRGTVDAARGRSRHRNGSRDGRRSSAVAAAEAAEAAAVETASSCSSVSALWCEVCHAEFTSYRRPHRCRACGKVVCAPCSPARRPKRTCKRCAVGSVAPRVAAAVPLTSSVIAPKPQAADVDRAAPQAAAPGSPPKPVIAPNAKETGCSRGAPQVAAVATTPQAVIEAHAQAAGAQAAVVARAARRSVGSGARLLVGVSSKLVSAAAATAAATATAAAEAAATWTAPSAPARADGLDEVGEKERNSPDRPEDEAVSHEGVRQAANFPGAGGKAKWWDRLYSFARVDEGELKGPKSNLEDSSVPDGVGHDVGHCMGTAGQDVIKSLPGVTLKDSAPSATMRQEGTGAVSIGENGLAVFASVSQAAGQPTGRDGRKIQSDEHPSYGNSGITVRHVGGVGTTATSAGCADPPGVGGDHGSDIGQATGSVPANASVAAGLGSSLEEPALNQAEDGPSATSVVAKPAVLSAPVSTIHAPQHVIPAPKDADETTTTADPEGEVVWLGGQHKTALISEAMVGLGKVARPREGMEEKEDEGPEGGKEEEREGIERQEHQHAPVEGVDNWSLEDQRKEVEMNSSNLGPAEHRQSGVGAEHAYDVARIEADNPVAEETDNTEPEGKQNAVGPCAESSGDDNLVGADGGCSELVVAQGLHQLLEGVLQQGKGEKVANVDGKRTHQSGGNTGLPAASLPLLSSRNCEDEEPAAAGGREIIVSLNATAAPPQCRHHGDSGRTHEGDQSNEGDMGDDLSAAGVRLISGPRQAKREAEAEAPGLPVVLFDKEEADGIEDQRDLGAVAFAPRLGVTPEGRDDARQGLSQHKAANRAEPSSSPDKEENTVDLETFAATEDALEEQGTCDREESGGDDSEPIAETATRQDEESRGGEVAEVSPSPPTCDHEGGSGDLPPVVAAPEAHNAESAEDGLHLAEVCDSHSSIAHEWGDGGDAAVTQNGAVGGGRLQRAENPSAAGSRNHETDNSGAPLAAVLANGEVGTGGGAAVVAQDEASGGEGLQHPNDNSTTTSCDHGGGNGAAALAAGDSEVSGVWPQHAEGSDATPSCDHERGNGDVPEALAAASVVLDEDVGGDGDASLMARDEGNRGDGPQLTEALTVPPSCDREGDVSDGSKSLAAARVAQGGEVGDDRLQLAEDALSARSCVGKGGKGDVPEVLAVARVARDEEVEGDGGAAVVARSPKNGGDGLQHTEASPTYLSCIHEGGEGAAALVTGDAEVVGGGPEYAEGSYSPLLCDLEGGAGAATISVVAARVTQDEAVGSHGSGALATPRTCDHEGCGSDVSTSVDSTSTTQACDLGGGELQLAVDPPSPSPIEPEGGDGDAGPLNCSENVGGGGLRHVEPFSSAPLLDVEADGGDVSKSVAPAPTASGEEVGDAGLLQAQDSVSTSPIADDGGDGDLLTAIDTAPVALGEEMGGSEVQQAGGAVSTSLVVREGGYGGASPVDQDENLRSAGVQHVAPPPTTPARGQEGSGGDVPELTVTGPVASDEEVIGGDLQHSASAPSCDRAREGADVYRLAVAAIMTRDEEVGGVGLRHAEDPLTAPSSHLAEAACDNRGGPVAPAVVGCGTSTPGPGTSGSPAAVLESHHVADADSMQSTVGAMVVDGVEEGDGRSKCNNWLATFRGLIEKGGSCCR